MFAERTVRLAEDGDLEAGGAGAHGFGHELCRHTSSKNGRSAITHDHRTSQAQIVNTIQDLGYRAEPTS
jgi:hypothetical protein